MTILLFPNAESPPTGGKDAGEIIWAKSKLAHNQDLSQLGSVWDVESMTNVSVDIPWMLFDGLKWL